MFSTARNIFFLRRKQLEFEEQNKNTQQIFVNIFFFVQVCRLIRAERQKSQSVKLSQSDEQKPLQRRATVLTASGRLSAGSQAKRRRGRPAGGAVMFICHQEDSRTPGCCSSKPTLQSITMHTTTGSPSSQHLRGTSAPRQTATITPSTFSFY